MGTDKKNRSSTNPHRKSCRVSTDVPWSTAFAVQLVQRLRDRGANVTPALRWLERASCCGREHDHRRNRARRSPAPERDERHGAQRDHEHASRVDGGLGGVLRKRQSDRCGILRSGSDFRSDGFPHPRSLPPRNRRSRAQNSRLEETEIARRVVAATSPARATNSGNGPSREEDPGYYLIAKGRRAFEKEIGSRVPPGTHIFRFHARVGVMSYVVMTAVLTAIVLAFRRGGCRIHGHRELGTIPACLCRVHSGIGHSRRAGQQDHYPRLARLYCPDWNCATACLPIFAPSSSCPRF